MLSKTRAFREQADATYERRKTERWMTLRPGDVVLITLLGVPREARILEQPFGPECAAEVDGERQRISRDQFRVLRRRGEPT